MPAASPARGEAPAPWGRFVRIFKQHVGERDHLVFSRPEHVIGRQAGVCDIVLKPVYISRRHCIVRLQGVDEAGEPVVMLSNESKYGVFVDRVAVNHLADVQLVTGSIVHFTEPDLPGQRHHAYRFELLPEGLTPALVAQREQLQLSETASTPAPPTTRKRKRGAVVSQSSQGSQGSVDSDELPVSARTRSRPEKKQRRGSVDPSSQIAAQSENTDTSNLSVNTSVRSSGTAPGKKRRRSDSWVLEEEGNSAADTVAATAQKQRKIDHENKIRLANVERELQRVRQQLDASERGRAQLQLGLSETQQQLADSQRQFADFQRQHTDSERQHRETVSMLEADRDARVLELKAENTALKMSSEKERAVLERKAKSMEMDIKMLNAKMERERMETRDKLVEADLIKARGERRHNEAYAFFHQGMLRLNRDPTQSSQEGSEESPSLLAARRQSLESTTQNEQSPPTPSLTATAPVVDGIARVVRADEAKSGSSQELSSQSQSQSQPQSQSQSQETVFLVAPYRGRAARRVLTSPDEEIKRQQ